MTEYLTGPRRLPPGFDRDGHLARLDADGFTIVKDYLGEDQLAHFREGLKPYLNTYRGRNSFEGLASTLPFGSAVCERDTDAKGEHQIWLARSLVDRQIGRAHV